MVTVPVISSYVLQGLPAFVRHEIGDEALQRANRAAGFDAELIEGRNCFIPQRAMMEFVDTIGREAGEPNLGLMIAPAMDVAAYGSFGRYVFGASTLCQAIKRSIAALRYHSTFDNLFVTVLGDEIRYSYTSALAGTKGYPAVATAAAGELLSVFRAYIRDNWRPMRIELDIETPNQISLFEETFQCPVIFNCPAIAIVFARHHLMATSKRRFRPIVTIEDVSRDWPGGAPQTLLDVAVSQIRTQVLSGGVMIEDIARSMDTSVRSLQREFERAGTDFRSLASTVRIQRATELLRHTGVSITDVSAELGYSSPANFARAFRKAMGVAPHEFRANRLHSN